MPDTISCTFSHQMYKWENGEFEDPKVHVSKIQA